MGSSFEQAAKQKLSSAKAYGAFIDTAKAYGRCHKDAQAVRF